MNHSHSRTYQHQQMRGSPVDAGRAQVAVSDRAEISGVNESGRIELLLSRIFSRSSGIESEFCRHDGETPRLW